LDYSETDKILSAISRPIILVLVLLFTTVAIGTSWFAVNQNKSALQNDRALTDAMLSVLGMQSYKFARDYAYWDTAVQNALVERNEAWLQENYYEAIDDIDGLTGLFVVNRAEGVLLSYFQHGGTAAKELDAVARTMASIVADKQFSERGPYVGYSANEGTLYAWGAFPFLISDPKRVTVDFGSDIPVLVIFGAYDAAALGEIASSFNLNGFRIGSDNTPEDAQMLLSAVSDDQFVPLFWRQVHPGTQLVQVIALPLAVITLLSILLYRRSRTITAQLLSRVSAREHLLTKQQAILAEHALPKEDKDAGPNPIDRILEQYCTTLNASLTSYWSLSDDKDAVLCEHLYAPAQPIGEMTRQMDVAKFPAIGPVIARGQMFVSDNIATDPRFSEMYAAEANPDRDQAIIFCPVILGGVLTGIVFAGRNERLGAWNKEDILFTRSVANIIALALTFEQLNDARMEALSANAAKSQFLANISHELRTPLNAVIGFSNLLHAEAEAKRLPQDVVEPARLIFESGQHLLAIVEDLLDLTSLDIGKYKMHESSFRLDDCMAKVGQLFQVRCQEKNLTIRRDSLEGIEVFADEKLIQRCLINLLSNAVKFSSAGSEICLGTVIDPTTGRLEIFVRDEGKGMTESELAAANQAFYQGEDTLTREHGGVGVGLALVKKFVELHEGTLTLDSKLEQGTTARLSLPLSRLVRLDTSGAEV